MARVAGLAMLGERAPDPLRATSRGVGELIAEVGRRGASEVLLGVGGTATNDGGAACLSALGFRFVDVDGHELPDGGGFLSGLARVQPPEHLLPRIRVACDVVNPMLGPTGSTRVFGPQKGVCDAETLARLEVGLSRLASFAPPGLAPTAPMTGAAGGIAFGLAAFAGARLERGSKLVLELLGFDDRLRETDIVVTGEGKLDGQTASGKIVGEVLRRSHEAGRRTFALCGLLGDDWEQLSSLLSASPVPIDRIDGAAEALETAAGRLANGFTES
jgi:glycerate 2-kinase